MGLLGLTSTLHIFIVIRSPDQLNFDQKITSIFRGEPSLLKF